MSNEYIDHWPDGGASAESLTGLEPATVTPSVLYRFLGYHHEIRDVIYTPDVVVGPVHSVGRLPGGDHHFAGNFNVIHEPPGSANVAQSSCERVPGSLWS